MFTYIFKVGTFQIRSAELILSVLDYALAAGYRHIGEFSSITFCSNDSPELNNSIINFDEMSCRVKNSR